MKESASYVWCLILKTSGSIGSIWIGRCWNFYRELQGQIDNLEFQLTILIMAQTRNRLMMKVVYVFSIITASSGSTMQSVILLKPRIPFPRCPKILLFRVLWHEQD